MRLGNKSKVPDKIITEAFDYVVDAFVGLEMSGASSNHFDTEGLILKVWDKKVGSKKDWSGWAYWSTNTIHLWVDSEFEVSLYKKDTLCGKKYFPVVGLDGLLVTGIAHELTHIYFNQPVHPITKAVEYSVSKKYWKKHSPGLFKTGYLLAKRLRRKL